MRDREPRDLLKAWLPPILWMVFIFIASTDLMSAEHTSRFIGPFLRWLKPDISLPTIAAIQFGVRKGGHVAEYAILGGLLLRAVRQRKNAASRVWVHAGAAYVLATIYAASDEFHQSFVRSRGASATDVMIDSAGALIGVLLFATWTVERSDRIPR